MNLIDLQVTEVLSKPYFNHMWCVDVIAEAWGSRQKTKVYFQKEEEAAKVDVGYTFQS
jgi:hypothetical protein